jgi:hypothetical protein
MSPRNANQMEVEDIEIDGISMSPDDFVIAALGLDDN